MPNNFFEKLTDAIERNHSLLCIGLDPNPQQYPAQGRLTLDRLIELMSTNPRRIYNLPQQSDTYIEVDPTVTYRLNNEDLHTKCGWNPFVGRQLTGRVERVVLRGQLAFDASQPGKEDKIVVPAGYGAVIP